MKTRYCMTAFLMIFLLQCGIVRAGEIHDAAKGGRLEVIIELAEENFLRLQEKDSEGNTPLHLAIAYNQEAVVAKVMDYKTVDINMENKKGETPLYLACRFAGLHIVKQILEAGGDPLIKTRANSTVMHAVGMSIHEDAAAISNLLLQSDESSVLPENKPPMILNAKDSWGMRPLHSASRSGNYSVAVVLLKKGADVKALDQLGRTALHWAAEEGNNEVAKLLLDNGVPFDVLCKNSGTALHLAIAANRVETVKLLLMEKRDLTIKDARGKTPLRLALEMNHRQIINILVQHGAKN